MRKLLSILLVIVICFGLIGCQKSYDYEISGLDINNISEYQQHDINILAQMNDEFYDIMNNGMSKMLEAPKSDRMKVAYDIYEERKLQMALDIADLDDYEEKMYTTVGKDEFKKYRELFTNYSGMILDYACKYKDDDCEIGWDHQLSKESFEQLQDFNELINDIRTDKN